MNDTFSETVQKMLVQLQLFGSSMALLAIVSGIILFLIWRRTGIPRQLVGKQRLARVPWDWLEVFLAALLFVYLLSAIVMTVPWGKHKLPAEGYAMTELSVLPLLLAPLTDVGIINAIGAVQMVPLELDRQTEDERSHMLTAIVLFPILLFFFFNVMRRLAGARLYQMGLHLNRWRENLTLGTAVWLVITPVCTLILMVVLLEFWETLWGRKSSHPMQVLLSRDPRMTTWFLVFMVTCILAPLKEELLMRGVMQPYLMRNPMASDILVVMSIVWAFTILMTPGTGPDRGMGMGPLLYIAVIAPAYYLFEKWTEPWITEPGAARGIFATSLFFAALHSPAWPTPIPLFVFSLAVGFLAYRTRSLVGPITVHALFNLTTMIALVLERYPNFAWK